MKKNNTFRWYLTLSISLVILSILLYLLHYAIFRDVRHIFIYLLGDIAFIPIQVLVVTIIIHQLLDIRAKKIMQEKMNMLVGVFFSEMGTHLLSLLSSADKNVNTLRETFGKNSDWTDETSKQVMHQLDHYTPSLDIQRDHMEKLKAFLLEKRAFVVRLLENPQLIERDEFAELLRALLHLTEEYAARHAMDTLPETDRKHLSGDAERVYRHLIREWVSYMHYLKVKYPYLFSLAMRTNPFDIGASPIIYGQ